MGKHAASFRRRVGDAHGSRPGGRAASAAGFLGFAVGLPLGSIPLMGMEMMDPPWVLGLALPLVYLVAFARTVGTTAPVTRRAAWRMLVVGTVVGVPWLWGLLVFLVAPVCVVCLCGWIGRRAFEEDAAPPVR